MAILFGTDGWRAVVGRDFTADNVAQIVRAFIDLYPTLPEAGRPVVVGFDRRNQSPETATLVTDLLTRHGITTFVAETFCTTPMVSWNVVAQQAAAGIMVTASHNPPQWNGIKFKESYGGAASPDFTTPIEARIATNLATGRAPRRGPGRAALERTMTAGPYLEHLRHLVDCDAIARAKLDILFDPLYGAGAGHLAQLVDGVTELHGARDIHFGGLHPEPIVPYVNEAITAMQQGRHDLCLITDGDADRIGAVDERGRHVTSHELFTLLLHHVVTQRGWTGQVVKSITTTRMIDRFCQRFDLRLTVTPVGFKHISPMLKGPAMLAGGEESGGIGFPRHLCERDGLFCALLVLEMVALRGRTLGELVAEMQSLYGPCSYRRIDLTLSAEQLATARTRLQGPLPTTLCGQAVIDLNRIDGLHFLRTDDSWLLIRSSGTEPLFRTYAEARTDTEVDALLAEAQHIIGV